MDRRAFLTLSAVAAAPRMVRAVTPQRGKGEIALVLGGGGCRGYAHIGVLRVLEKLGVKPDLIVGSSVGSLVGALYAAGAPMSDLEFLGDDFSPSFFRSLTLSRLGFLSGERIRRFVVERAGERTIESLPVRFAAVATDLRSGEIVLISRGDLGRAVQASSSVPGLVEPVALGAQLCVDGNLVAPVPVDAARGLGARFVIAVDVSFPPADAELANPIDALYQGYSILSRKLALEERARADILIAPDIPRHNDMSVATLRALIESGERATEAAAPQLRALTASR